MQKKKQRNEKYKGNSKYARKIAKRRQLAIKLGLSADTPYPVIWAIGSEFGRRINQTKKVPTCQRRDFSKEKGKKYVRY